MHRKKGIEYIGMINLHVHLSQEAVVDQVGVGEHYSLRDSCGSRCVEDCHQVGYLPFHRLLKRCIFKGEHIVFICRIKGIVRSSLRKHTFYHIVFFFIHKGCHRLAEVDKILKFFLVEGVVQRNNDSSC